MYIKITGTMYAIILYASNVDTIARNYVIFTFQNKRDMKQFHLTKQLVLFILFAFFMTNLYFLFHLLFQIGTPITMSMKDTYRYFLYIGLEALFFAIVSSYLMILINHPFAYIVPILGFWIMEVWSTSEDFNQNSFLKTVFSIIPIIIHSENEYQFVNSSWIYFVEICLLIYIFIQINLQSEVRL